MQIKKTIGKIHLWLGLSSGLVVFIVAITGCIYAFQAEIQDLIQPYRFVESKEKPFLPPSRIRKIADAKLPGKHIHGVLYQGKENAAQAIYYKYQEYYDFVYVNPYSGEVLKVKNEYASFFRFILDGHFYLWLPHEIGQPVVASFTLVFVLMLISGLYLWWPRNKKGVRKNFTIRWDARWRRKNYDLHRVLGFYIIAIGLILGLTGLVWGFEWFRDSVHEVAGGEKSLVYEEPESNAAPSDQQFSDNLHPVDYLWYQMQDKYPHAGSIEMHFPSTEKSPIHVAINPDPGTYWQIDYIYFDQYTFREIEAEHIYSRFEDANAADKLIRMNYDIHTGAILGLPGKILAFLSSLLIASLPITGFLIWIGRNKQHKTIKKPLGSKRSTHQVSKEYSQSY